MFKNHFKIAIRTLWKQKLTAAINIFGLSLGIAAACIAFVFVRHEYSFDQFHDEYEKIYWLSAKINKTFNLSTTPGPLAPELKANFSEVTEFLRLEENEILVEAGGEILKERALFVESNFFDFFDFTLKRGDASSALSEINTVVLNESMARKYFGRQNPVGEDLTIIFRDERRSFKVTGVAQAAPSNSSIEFDFVLPIRQVYRDSPQTLDSDWSNFPVTSFVRLRETTDLPSLRKNMLPFIQSKFDAMEEVADPKFAFEIHALQDYHLNEGMTANGLKEQAEKSYVNMMAFIALLILVVACLNFTNLSNAMGSRRLTEVGVRQVLGAEKKQLIAQFLTESILISVLSLGVGVILIDIFIPFATPIFNFPLQIEWLQPSVFIPLILITLLTGLIAGAYPSFLLARLKTINTFKSNYKIGGNNLVTKGGMIFQFVLSIGLLSCTLIIFQQQRFIQNHNLGFDQEAIVVIPTHTNYKDTINTERIVNNFRAEVMQQPGVLQVAGVSNSFNRGNQAIFIKQDDGTQAFVFDYRVDPHYIDLLNIELVAGRNFSPEIPEDRSRSLIVNQAFVREYEVGDIDQYRLPKEFDNLADHRIIGVTGDYHFSDLKTSIKPMILHMKPKSNFQHILVRVKPDDFQSTIARLKTSWQRIRPDKPFEFSFLDEDIQRQYDAEERWSRVISIASLLAILIALLGLFGLVSLALAERVKEIGIRKVLGANIEHIISLFSIGFLKLLLIATLIASPLSLLYMQRWLQDFQYHIRIQWWVFGLAGLAAMTLALLTIGIQSLRAARANPVESLKNE